MTESDIVIGYHTIHIEFDPDPRDLLNLEFWWIRNCGW